MQRQGLGGDEEVYASKVRRNVLESDEEGVVGGATIGLDHRLVLVVWPAKFESWAGPRAPEV